MNNEVKIPKMAESPFKISSEVVNFLKVSDEEAEKDKSTRIE